MDNTDTSPLATTTADYETRVESLCTQIDTLIAAQGAPGRLPDYLISPDEEVRKGVATHFTEHGFAVTVGFEANSGPWMNILPPRDK